MLVKEKDVEKIKFICYIWLSGTITASCLVPLLLYVAKLVQINVMLIT